METQQVENKKVSKRGTHSRKFSLETKIEAIHAYKKGNSITEIAGRFNGSSNSIYNWIRSYKLDPEAFVKRHGNLKTNDTTATTATTDLVTKVVEDIRAGKTGAHSRSFAEDFGISQEPSHNSNIELKFCPCCGTNIKAVRIALETYQEIKG
jgi:transposase-like protein